MKQARRLSIKSLNGPFRANTDREFICLSGSHLTAELLARELEIVCG
jgi:hypothetical protein